MTLDPPWKMATLVITEPTIIRANWTHPQYGVASLQRSSTYDAT